MGLFARLIIGVMLLMSLLSLLGIVERALFFQRGRSASLSFAAATAEKLAAGKFAEVLAGLGSDPGYRGRVMGAGLTAHASHKTADRDHKLEAVARALERQAAREVQSFKRGTGMLATIGSTAPFVGLLGTVVGIVNAFQQMAATGSGGLGTVSAGISEALVTTAFGLLVAIPAVMAFNTLQGWIEARSVDMSEASNELLDTMALHLNEQA